jgi:hypothetical protein
MLLTHMLTFSPSSQRTEETEIGCVSGRSGKPTGAVPRGASARTDCVRPPVTAVRRGLGAKHATRPRADSKEVFQRRMNAFGRGTPNTEVNALPCRWYCSVRFSSLFVNAGPQ